MYSIKGATIYVLCEESGEILEKIAVKTNRVTFGSYPLNNIRLHTLNTERLHCKIFADSSNTVTIVNYSQSNPVRVNNCSVKCSSNLHDNDKFEVAGCLFMWNFNPANIKGVSKPRKRTIQQYRRKTIALKRIRSTGDFEKQSCTVVPRTVSLMLDAYRKRRTIHSTISGQQPLCDANMSIYQCDQNNVSDHGNALAAVCTPTAPNITQPDLTPTVTPLIEKENIVPADVQNLITGDLVDKSHTPVSKRRHLACHTPVSHLIDLTTPPPKSRATSAARKVLSGKAVQSPRVLDVVNIVTPSPKKINRTPISLRNAASTPKTTLLKSAIKNSRTQEPDSKKTPLPSAFVKKTPNVKLNTPRVNTPKPTPTGVKSSTPKIKRHLISTLNDKKAAVTVYKMDSPVPIINLEESSKHSTPTLRKRSSAVSQRRSVCVTPKGQLLERCNLPKLDNSVTSAKTEKYAELESPSVVPIIDVQSIIKKPNRTTQIRSAKYSDITPHESFADGIPIAAIASEENVIVLQTESSMSSTHGILQDELKCVSNIPSIANPNRNSCASAIAPHCSESSQQTRKTMSDFSSALPGSPLRPLSHNKVIQSKLESLDDLAEDTNMIALPTVAISAEEDLDENELLAEIDVNPPQQNYMVNSTPELRHSWRHTRKCIGSAFTSLNTSRPQLDLTAEIDESLVITEDEEAIPENNELYNLECSNSHSSTGKEQMVVENANMNKPQTPQIPVTSTETTSDLLSRSSSAELTSLNGNTITDCALTKPEHVHENGTEQGASISLENVLHLGASDLITSIIDKDSIEVEEILESQTSEVPETATETTSVLLSQSLDEEPVSSNGDNNSECSVTEQKQDQEDAVDEEADHCVENVLHSETSELISNHIDKGSSVCQDSESSEIVQEQDQEDIADQEADNAGENVMFLDTSELISNNFDKDSIVSEDFESSEIDMEQVQEDAVDQDADRSVENVLQSETSEVIPSGIGLDIKEVEEISEPQTSEAPEVAAEISSDLLSHSLDEELVPSNAHNILESLVTEEEQAQEDTADQEADHSVKNVLHSETSEISSSNIDKDSSVSEDLESSEAEQEQIQEEAENQVADHSVENVLHLESSEVIPNGIDLDIKEGEEISGSQTSEAPEAVAEIKSDLLSHSLDEEPDPSNAHNILETSVTEVEQVQEDTADQEADHSVENVILLDTSEVIPSSISLDIEEAEEISGSQTSEAPETPAETTPSHSLDEEPVSSNANNNSECSVAEQQQVHEDAADQEADHSVENVLQSETSEVIPSGIDLDIKEGEEISGSQTSEAPAVETSLVLPFQSLDDDPVPSNSDNNSECSVTEEEQVQVQKDAVDEEADHSVQNVLHSETSELISSDIDKDSSVSQDFESSEIEQEQDQEYIADQEAEHSVENVLHSETSEIISSSISLNIKEFSGPQTLETPKGAAETTTVIPSQSLAEEPSSTNSDKHSESSVTEQGQDHEVTVDQETDNSADIVMHSEISELISSHIDKDSSVSQDFESSETEQEIHGEAVDQEADHSVENVIILDTSEVIPSSINKDSKEVEEISGSQTSEAPETPAETTAVLPSQSLDEEPVSSNANDNSECSVAEQQQVHEDAADQEADHSVENVIILDTSEVIPSSINKDSKEVEEVSGSQTSEAPETPAETTAVLPSQSLDEEPVSSNANNNSECSVAEQQQVHEDAADQEADHSVENVLHSETSEVIPSGIDLDIKEGEEISGSQTSEAPEAVAEIKSDLHSQSLDEKQAPSNTHNNSECAVTGQEQIHEDAADQEVDNAVENEVHSETSEVISSIIDKKDIKELDEISVSQTSESAETVANSASDLPTNSLDKEPVSRNSDINSECSVTEQESVQKDDADKTTSKRADENVQHLETPGQGINNENNDHKNEDNSGKEPEKLPSAPKVSKRRLYSKNDYISETPNHNGESPQAVQVVIPNDYPSLMKIPKNDKKAPVVENQIRESRPKRTCRLKITSLAEEFLAGNSPAPKFVKPKPGITEDNDTLAADEGESDTTQHAKSDTSTTQNATVDVSFTDEKTAEAEVAQTLNVVTSENDQKKKDEATVARRGRGRRKAVLEETTIDKTPVRKGRGRKKVSETAEAKPLGEADVIEQEVMPSDGTSIERVVDLRSDEDNKKPEHTIESETEKQALEPAEAEDKPRVARKGRTQKLPILEDASSERTPVRKGRGRRAVGTNKEEAATEKPLDDAETNQPEDGRKRIADLRGDENNQKTENILTNQAAEPVESDSLATDDKERLKDKPSVARKGRARKQALLDESVASVKTPVRKGRKVAKNDATEKPLSEDEIIEPNVAKPVRKGRKRVADLRSDEDNQKAEQKVQSDTEKQAAPPAEVGSIATDDKEKKADKPTGVRKGRTQKLAVLEDASSERTPVRKGRGRRAVETVKEVTGGDATETPLGDAVVVEPEVGIKRSVDLCSGEVEEAAEPVESGSMATDDKQKQQDKPTVARKGRAQKLAVQEDGTSERTPVRKGRGRRAVETVKEVTVSDATDETPLGEAVVVEPDVDKKPRKGRAPRNLAHLEETSSTSTPIKKSRGRRAVDAVCDLRSDEDNQKTENTLTTSQAAEPVEPGSMASDDKEKLNEKPTVARRGRPRKQALLEELEPNVSTPAKKGRKEAEKTKENDGTEETPLGDGKIIEPEVATPARKGRRRKVEFSVDEDNQKVDDTNELSLRTKRTRRQAQEAVSEDINDAEDKNDKKSTSQTKARRMVKKNDESVSDNNTAVVSDVAESPKSDTIPRKTRAKRV